MYRDHDKATAASTSRVTDPLMVDICTIVFVDSLQGRRLRHPK